MPSSRIAYLARKSRGERLPPYDRFLMAMHHAGEGDIQTALTAMTYPHHLSPLQQREAFDDVDWEAWSDDAEKRGVGKALRSIIKNPIIVGGFLMAMVWPFGREAIARTIAKPAKRYDNIVGPLMRAVSSPMELLETRAGKPTVLGRLLSRAERTAESEHEAIQGMASAAFRRFAEIEGREPRMREAVRVMLYLEKPWDPKSPMYARWKAIRAATRNPRIGIRPFSLTKAERELYRLMTDIRTKYWKEVVSQAAKTKGLRAELKARGVDLSKGPSSIPTEFYAPHALYVDPRLKKGAIRELLHQGRFDEAIAVSNPYTPWTITSQHEFETYVRRGFLPTAFRRRTYQLVPSPTHLKFAEEVTHPGTVEALEGLLRSKGGSAEKMLWGAYSLDSPQVFARYADSMARFKAWELSGIRRAVYGYTKEGKRHTGEIDRLRTSDPWLAGYLENTTIPALRGRLTYNQLLRAQDWEARKMGWVEWMNKSEVFKKPLLRDLKGWVEDALLGSGRLSHRAGAESAISMYLYGSALGWNLSSSFANLMQTMTTTLNFLGPQATSAGIFGAIRRTGRYVDARSRGVEAAAAYRHAFKDLVEMGVHSRVMGEEAFRRILEDAWAYTSHQGALSKGSRKLMTVLMAPFKSAEMANRLVAFDGGKWLAKHHGLSREGTLRFAREAVEKTQFLQGPLMSPTFMESWLGQVSLPVVGHAPLRMFMQFSSRLAGYYGHALRRGEWGKLGMAAAGPLAATELAREGLGVDISRETGWEQLPIPMMRKFGSFGAVPLVPPIAQIAAAPFEALFRGETAPLAKVLPLLVPGGVALSRLSLRSEAVAEMLGRQYVDYEHPTPDGKFPLHKANGQRVADITPTQLYMLELGFRPADLSDEQQFAMWLKKQRDTLREIRREAVEAYVENDMVALSKARQRWKKLYGTDLQLKDSDLRALEDRKMLARAEILLKQLSPEVRPQFQQMMHGAIAERLGLYSEGRPRMRVIPEPRDDYSALLY